MPPVVAAMAATAFWAVVARRAAGMVALVSTPPEMELARLALRAP